MQIVQTGTGRVLVLGVGLVVILADQITKAIVVGAVPLHTRVRVIDGVLALTHVRNRGMAFGLFNGIDAGWLRWVLVAVAVAAVVIIWSYARQEAGHPGVLIAFGAILGGAVGNLIDRLRFGYVVDFVLAHWGRHEFPAFNVADSAITIGGIVLFLTLARDSGAPEPDVASPSTPETPAEATDARDPVVEESRPSDVTRF